MAASDSMLKSQLSLWDSGHLNFVNHQRLCWTSPRFKEAFTECVGMRLRDGANKPWSICKGRCPRRGRPNRIKPCFAEREAQARPDIGPHHHHSRGRAKLCLLWPWPLFTMKGGHYCQDDTAPGPGAPRVKWWKFSNLTHAAPQS